MDINYILESIKNGNAKSLGRFGYAYCVFSYQIDDKFVNIIFPNDENNYFIQQIDVDNECIYKVTEKDYPGIYQFSEVYTD